MTELKRCPKPDRTKDLLGQQFGQWTVIRFAGVKKYDGGSSTSHWVCKCSCGARGTVAQYALTSGRAVRCQTCGRKTHGHTGSPTYASWASMKSRCHNPGTTGYRDYGGRGIKVCSRWQNSFANFLADMGERPEGKSLDRRDNNGNYEPGNCRWASQTEQNQNKRRYRMQNSQWRRMVRAKHIHKVCSLDDLYPE
jgi:hypothetical protein